MKFYREKINADFYWEQIAFKKINAIYFDTDVIAFYKDGLHHNSKNAAFINNKGFKDFYLINFMAMI
jgi:hypothetical protein